MDRPETISLLRHAHDEVISLRRQVADRAIDRAVIAV